MTLLPVFREIFRSIGRGTVAVKAIPRHRLVMKIKPRILTINGHIQRARDE
jgi:hypothetical protein